MKRLLSAIAIIFYISVCDVQAQALHSNVNATLQQCVQYALEHQPDLQRALLDEQIADREIKGRLAEWYPQVALGYNVEHYFQLPVSIFRDTPTKVGLNNNSSIGLGVNQVVFNRDVLLAKRSAKDVRTQVKQNIVFNKIDIVVNVSKAFYDVLFTGQQITLAEEDIKRTDRSLKDARSQYSAGIVDKTDYKRATINLNNAQIQKKRYEELLNAKYAYLKDAMGYPVDSMLRVVNDTARIAQDVYLNLLSAGVAYENRIEYQILQTQRLLQESNLRYAKWAYIPSVSFYGAYNMNFQNSEFPKLYSQNYPNSYIGLTLSFPLFEGMKRKQEIKSETLQLYRIDYDIMTLKDNINTAYQQVLAVYNTNLANYKTLETNQTLAEEVYQTIVLQYRAGIKTFLDVTIAETDLRNAQNSYISALYEVLSSKLDVQKALGIIQW